MKAVAYCNKCDDNKEHSIKKLMFFGRKIEAELDCGHTMVVWGIAVTTE